MADLKPCPFCGGKVRIAETRDGCQLWWFVTRGMEKNKCTCRVFMESECFFPETPTKEKQKMKQDLIEAWNRRAENEELLFTRQFILDKGLLNELLKAWNRGADNAAD